MHSAYFFDFLVENTSTRTDLVVHSQVLMCGPPQWSYVPDNPWFIHYTRSLIPIQLRHVKTGLLIFLSSKLLVTHKGYFGMELTIEL